jgi:hypothetical protein
VFVTSARYGHDGAQQESQAHGGAVFEISGLAITGLPSWRPYVGCARKSAGRASTFRTA